MADGRLPGTASVEHAAVFLSPSLLFMGLFNVSLSVNYSIRVKTARRLVFLECASFRFLTHSEDWQALVKLRNLFRT